MNASAPERDVGADENVRDISGGDCDIQIVSIEWDWIVLVYITWASVESHFGHVLGRFGRYKRL